VQYAKAMGLNVVGLDVTPEKLALARSVGADVTVNALDADAAAQVLEATHGGAHGVLVTAPSPPAFSQAIAFARSKGTITLIGLPPGGFQTPIFDVVLKGLTIRGSIVGTVTGTLVLGLLTNVLRLHMVDSNLELARRRIGEVFRAHGSMDEVDGRCEGVEDRHAIDRRSSRALSPWLETRPSRGVVHAMVVKPTLRNELALSLCLPRTTHAATNGRLARVHA